VAIAACGDDAPQIPDAAPMPDASPDSAPMFPACKEFAGPAATLPAHVVGSLMVADVQSPASCSDVDAPYGIESAGPDSVVRIDGLALGTPYIVKLTSAADLAFYVASGCSSASGPAASECKLFVDASAGTREVGRFVADAATTYIVVDYYASATPSSQSFTLDVYPESCTARSECSTTAQPACVAGQCVECETSFDCTSAAKPRCDATTNTCVAGIDSCTNDDANEPANDGPAGAVSIVGNAASLSGAICSSPRRIEADFYSFQVTSVGETWNFDLNWNGGRDLDLVVFDASGNDLGLSYWENPEHVRVTYLPVGTYYARVTDFSTATTMSVGYTLNVTRTAGSGCTTRAQCAGEYRNQLYRGYCVAGACVPIAGAGTVAEGSACDSVSDCASGLSCPSFFFVANADTRDVCGKTCTSDSQCNTGEVCTTYLDNNLCVQKCTTDAQCPTSIDDTPANGTPWYRLQCNVATGKCGT
jgi:hypothetical protein